MKRFPILAIMMVVALACLLPTAARPRYESCPRSEFGVPALAGDRKPKSLLKQELRTRPPRLPRGGFATIEEW
jgi:hypothetical protein